MPVSAHADVENSNEKEAQNEESSAVSAAIKAANEQKAIKQLGFNEPNKKTNKPKKQKKIKRPIKKSDDKK